MDFRSVPVPVDIRYRICMELESPRIEMGSGSGLVWVLTPFRLNVSLENSGVI